MSQTNTDILVLILANGDQILAEVQEQTGAYIATNPLQILTRPDESTGQMTMGIVEYLPYCDTSAGLAIPTGTAILAIPSQDLKNHYAERFGVIIAPPVQKIII
jgi:hypothetical protein